MDTTTLTGFFMWCTIVDGALLVLWTVLSAAAPDLMFRTQRLWFRGSRETFDLVMYAFLGLFKIFFLVFNLVPWIALSIVA